MQALYSHHVESLSLYITYAKHWWQSRAYVFRAIVHFMANMTDPTSDTHLHYNNFLPTAIRYVETLKLWLVSILVELKILSELSHITYFLQLPSESHHALLLSTGMLEEHI